MDKIQTKNIEISIPKGSISILENTVHINLQAKSFSLNIKSGDRPNSYLLFYYFKSFSAVWYALYQKEILEFNKRTVNKKYINQVLEDMSFERNFAHLYKNYSDSALHNSHIVLSYLEENFRDSNHLKPTDPVVKIRGTLFLNVEVFDDTKGNMGTDKIYTMAEIFMKALRLYLASIDRPSPAEIKKLLKAKIQRINQDPVNYMGELPF